MQIGIGADCSTAIRQQSHVNERLLYFCIVSVGGTSKNSIEQAKALDELGVAVDFLCPTDFQSGELSGHSKTVKKLYSGPKHGQHSKLVSRFFWAAKLLENTHMLATYIKRSKHTHVLWGSFFEYLSPFWAPRLNRLKRQGVTFGAIVNDPVRNYMVGPAAWHCRSVATAYSVFREAFVYKDIILDTVRPMPQLRTTVIPHGPYFYPEWPDARRKTREELGISMNAPVLLSFGHLRNNKNLMLVMEALRNFPEVHLMVVGSEAAPGQTTAEQYQARAAELGVGSQVHWVIRYVGDDEVKRFFDAADYAIMTYSRTFRSTSGILHITAPMRMPVLVSCGDAPLGKMVEEFRLGHRVEPDSVEEIRAGIKRLLSGDFVGDWDAFNGRFTYEENARMVRERMFEKI